MIYDESSRCCVFVRSLLFLLVRDKKKENDVAAEWPFEFVSVLVFGMLSFFSVRCLFSLFLTRWMIPVLFNFSRIIDLLAQNMFHCWQTKPNQKKENPSEKSPEKKIHQHKTIHNDESKRDAKLMGTKQNFSVPIIKWKTWIGFV